jgi:DNA-binding transcriptional regulator YhcF (GntR family)
MYVRAGTRRGIPAWRVDSSLIECCVSYHRRTDMPFLDQSCIDKSLPIPVGRQLHGLLSYVIAFGFIPSGERLPSVRELAQAVGVAPMTVNDVYQELREAGLIEIRAGVGAFASSDGQQDAERLALRADIAALIEKGARIGLSSDRSGGDGDDAGALADVAGVSDRAGRHLPSRRARLCGRACRTAHDACHVRRLSDRPTVRGRGGAIGLCRVRSGAGAAPSRA